MSVNNQGDIARLLQLGINEVAQFEYERYEPEYKQYLAVLSSDKAYEIDVSMAGYGAAQLKPEGAEIAGDSYQQLYQTVYKHNVFALSTNITFESIANNLYFDGIEKSGRLLEESLQETEQLVAADLINNGYNAAFPVIANSTELFSTTHTLKNGTFSNRLTTFAALSEASLEDACIQIKNYVNPAGLRIRTKVKGLCVPNNLMFTAKRLLGSEFQAETANNATNAIVNMGSIPQGYSTHTYFTDPDAWFLTTSTMSGGKFYQRMGHTFKSDNSNTNNWNYRHSGITYFSVGVTDPRAFFGSGPSA